jgi:hypothetical protein
MFAVAVFTTEVDAQQFLVMGAGNTRCEAWTNERRAGGDSAEAVPNSNLASWVSGFLSGVNSTYATLAAPEREDILLESEVKPEEIWAYIDRFCKESPSATLFQATNALGNDLQTRLLQNRRRKQQLGPTGSKP